MHTLIYSYTHDIYIYIYVYVYTCICIYQIIIDTSIDRFKHLRVHRTFWHFTYESLDSMMHTLLDWYMHEFIEKPFRSFTNPGIHRTSYEFIAKSYHFIVTSIEEPINLWTQWWTDAFMYKSSNLLIHLLMHS